MKIWSFFIDIPIIFSSDQVIEKIFTDGFLAHTLPYPASNRSGLFFESVISLGPIDQPHGNMYLFPIIWLLFLLRIWTKATWKKESNLRKFQNLQEFFDHFSFTTNFQKPWNFDVIHFFSKKRVDHSIQDRKNKKFSVCPWETAHHGNFWMPFERTILLSFAENYGLSGEHSVGKSVIARLLSVHWRFRLTRGSSCPRCTQKVP